MSESRSWGRGANGIWTTLNCCISRNGACRDLKIWLGVQVYPGGRFGFQVQEQVQVYSPNKPWPWKLKDLGSKFGCKPRSTHSANLIHWNTKFNWEARSTCLFDLVLELAHAPSLHKNKHWMFPLTELQPKA